MILRIFYSFLLSFLFLLSGIYASDTISLNHYQSHITIDKSFFYYEDKTNKLTIDDLLKHTSDIRFNENKNTKLNFGYSLSTIWLKFTINNASDSLLNYFLELSNPDIDYVAFYVTKNDTLVKSVVTGELADVKSREIEHRNFLFDLPIPKQTCYVYYLAVNNNGHSCSIPLKIEEKSTYRKNDYTSELINWLLYGVLFFVIIFNIYLYFALKDKVNLYYSISLLFALLFLVHYEGYLYLFNPGFFVEKLKWITPCFYVLFLLSFTQAFVIDNNQYKKINRFINPLKFVVPVAPFTYFLKYPFSFIADIGVPILILMLLIFIIWIAVKSFSRNNPPSQIFLYAFIAVFMGMLIHELKEFDIINPTFFTINSIKIGLTLQNILLTIAVLERFRLNQNKAKLTIEENLRRIEVQNKELEIINTELEKLSIVASETDNSIAIYDNQGRLEWGNTGFEKLYEKNINELIRVKKDYIQDIVPNKDIKKYMLRCMDSMLPVVFETAVYTRNNKETWIQTTLSPFIRKGSIFKIIAIDTDITSLKEYGRELEIAKEKAVESDRLKTAFLHNISHEIRTPMNAIIGFSGLLTEDEVQPEKRRQYTDIIIQSSNHLLSVINDIMRIASIEAGQENLSESEFDLNLVFEYLHEQFWLKAREQNNGIEIKTEIPDEELLILSDETKLVQILSNLVDNALKFTPKGSITFGYSLKDNTIEFFVKDTGIGIAPELHEEIFKRFHQVENTNTRKFGGSGLGLSISKAYVELMGGKIWVISELNKGSEFRFSIPLIVPSSTDKANEHEQFPVKINSYSKTILIAEDEEANFNLLKEQLSDLKVEIVRARNGLEAVNFCMANKVDIILMDIKMPVMDGFTATMKIREVHPDLPIIAQTAYNTNADRQQAKASGCSDFLSKPVIRAKMHKMIRTYLDGV
jgi:signal transduction histidine kinase/CheY-like chemotaxis protein